MNILEREFVENVIDNNKDLLKIKINKSDKLEINPLRGGSSNVIYKVSNGHQSLLFKHRLKNKRNIYYKDNLEREFEITDFLYSNHKITPEPLVFDKESEVLISEFVEGKIPKQTDRDFHSTLALIGNSLNKLRKVPISILERVNTGTRICPKEFYKQVILPTTTILATDLLREGSPSLFQFLEEISTIIGNKLRFEPKLDCQVNWSEYSREPKKFPYGLLHNDLSLRNIIVTGSKKRPICFIDWEQVDFGDLAYDLAYFQSENMILPQQINIITQLGNVDPYILARTNRYIKIFLPMLELGNAYWAINHITNMLDFEDSKSIKLRPPYSITENLNFIRLKIKRLVRLSHLENEINAKKELELFSEIQYALKIFESQLTLE